MADKNKKSHKMNRAEFAINKPLLREANTKFKDQSQANVSQRDGGSEQGDI
jgi:hypothetical protein